MYHCLVQNIVLILSVFQHSTDLKGIWTCMYDISGNIWEMLGGMVVDQWFPGQN